MPVAKVPGRTLSACLRSAGREPISPELALIDPELRRQAREALPGVPEEPWARSGNAPTAQPGGWAADTDTENEDAAAERPRARRGLRPVVRAGGLAAAAVTLAVAGARMIDLQGRVSDQPRERPAMRQAVRPTPSVEPAPVRLAKRRASRARDAAISRQAAARTFIWPSVPGAEYYNVQFLRRRHKVFEAWPRSARLVVVPDGVAGRRRFRFSPGRYRWIVRPGFGARSRRRYGAPIVVSTWTFTRAAKP